MKKIILIALALILLTTSFILATKQYTEVTSIDCSKPVLTERSALSTTKVTWVWQWWPERDEGKASIQCVGPAAGISYRPLDLAALNFVLSIAIFVFASKKR